MLPHLQIVSLKVVYYYVCYCYLEESAVRPADRLVLPQLQIV